MPDLTITTQDALTADHAFQVMQAAGRELLFPTQYALDKIARKVAAEVADYRTAAMTTFAALAAEGKADAVPNGYQAKPEYLDEITALLAPALAESVTLTGVRKIRMTELADVKLTRVELEGLRPFLDDSDEAAGG